jgi:ribosomal protein S18 acetylase RimI-like enzyme
VHAPSLPEGLTSRAATRDDVPAITGLIAACELANDGSAEIDPSDVAQAFERAGPGYAGPIVVLDGVRIVAWAVVHGERVEIDVHPAWRGRGIGTALLRWAEGRVTVAGLSRIRQTVTDNDRAAIELLGTLGYERAHTSWLLELPLADDPPTVPIPEGITIRPYQAEDEVATHRLIDDAFSEWPDREPLALDAWAALITAHGAFSPELSRLAFEADELVGVALAFDYDTAAEGWVQQLATKATHRHRGIARALLASVFAAFHARGRRLVGLSTDSRTGALTLYERLGMRIRRSYTGWAKNLP